MTDEELKHHLQLAANALAVHGVSTEAVLGAADHIEAQQSRIAELKAALRPFALLGLHKYDQYSDQYAVVDDLKAIDFSRARSAYGEWPRKYDNKLRIREPGER